MIPAKRKPTPRNLALDLLRMTRHEAVAASDLVRAGKLFGFSDTAVRVALSRLVAEGKLDNADGGYRLSAGTDPLTDYVERWRQGDQRRRAWQAGEWLMVSLPRRPERSARARSCRALEFVGFREAREGLWVRPDNLVAPMTEQRERYRLFGLESGAWLFSARDVPANEQYLWASTLWDGDRLLARYREMLDRIRRSSAHLAQLPAEQALVESFVVGGDAIHTLVKDPLLPDELLLAPDRERLCQAMLDYDRLGRAIWARHVSAVRAPREEIS